MIDRLGAMITRARDILRTEGPVQLFTRGFDYVRRRLFTYGKYYLYEHSLGERNEADFLPKTSDFTFEVVRSNADADELAAAVGCDFRRRFIGARKGLDKGAIAFCIFSGGEIAHIGSVALTEEAKRTFDYLPYEVDFTNKVACTGGTETCPAHRGKGFMVYGYFKRFQFLAEQGMVASRNAVAVDNIASQKGHAKFNPRIYARARYLKLFGREFWKETPLQQTGNHD
ncbi:hypothetical protein ACFLXV_01140 [Chloroflexota bacterium]